MKNSTAVAAFAAFAASTGLLSAPPVRADAAADPLPAGQHVLGGQAQIGDSAWTVSNLKPSSDAIPYHPAGTLWEATATDEATHGSTTPIVSNFNARAHSGQTYRELFQIASPNGVNPAGLAQGQKVSGKLYFDVTGDAPDSVTYSAGGPDLALWVQPPPSASSAGGSGSRTTTPTGSTTTGTTPATQPAAQPAARPGGSAGTVIPGAAQGTPASGAAPGPQPPTAGNPASAGTPTPAQAPGEPAPANPQPGPAPAAPNPGSPLAPGTQVPPSAVPAPAGSQGTPLQPGTEQPSPSPANPQPATAPAANTPPSPSATPPPAG